MAFPRGRKLKPKRQPDANSRTSSQKSKAEDAEGDSQQEDGETDEPIDSNDAGNTQLKLDRQSILEFCTDYEAASRKLQAKKQTPLLDLLDEPQLEVLKVLFPGIACPPEWIAFQRKERARMRQEAAEANKEYVPVPIVREVSAFTYEYVIKYTPELQGQHIAVIKQNIRLKQFLLEYDMTLIGMLRTFFGAHDPVQVRDELTEVQMKTENGILADVGKYVTEIYTALQGIQLPDDELNLVKALLKELAKTVPHLAGAFTADPTWYPSTIKEYTECLLEMAKRQHESNGYFSDWMSPVVEEGRPTLEQYNKVCKEVKELKLRLKNEGRNRSESHGKPKFRHSEEQPMVQGKDQPIEGKERLIPSCTNCGKTGHSISNCWKKGGGAYQEDQPAPATKKLRSQLNPTNLKAQTAAITAMQSKFDKLCSLLEPLVKSQLEADQH
jgi:hypothetical protein